MTPGFVALTFEAKLSCSVAVTDANGTHTALVKGYGLNHGQFAKDVNWQEAYDPAFEEFIANFGTQWDSSGVESCEPLNAVHLLTRAYHGVYRQVVRAHGRQAGERGIRHRPCQD